MNTNTSNSNSNNTSISRSTRSQCLKRKLETEVLRWDKLYNDLLILVLEYCDQLTLTQLVMHINQYWNTSAKSSRVWNNRSIGPFNPSEFQFFILTHSYLINVISWCWYNYRYYYPFNYQSMELILQYQSTVFIQLKSIKFSEVVLSESAMIVICTSFNSLISLSFYSCFITYSGWNQLKLNQYFIVDNNRNKLVTTKPNRLLTQLKQLELNFCNVPPVNYNFLYNLINLESLTIIYCGTERFVDPEFDNNNNNNTIGLYSLIANRMPSLTYLNTDVCKITESTELQLIQFNAIAQLIQRLNTCLIKNNIFAEDSKHFNSKDWIDIFKSAVINNNNPLHTIILPYSAELIEYLVQFSVLTRLEIESNNITNTDIKSLSALTALTELHLSTDELSPLIFTEFPSLSLTKLKLLSIGNIDAGQYTKVNDSQFKQLLIELLNCQSLIELYLNLSIEELPSAKSKQKNKQSTISNNNNNNTEFIDLIDKFNKLKLLYISEWILPHFYPNMNLNKPKNNNEWIKKFNGKLSKLLSNTIVQLGYFPDNYIECTCCNCLDIL